MLMEDVLGGFWDALKKASLGSPVLAFANFNKPFLLADWCMSKLGLGAMLSQKQTDGQYHPVAYAWAIF